MIDKVPAPPTTNVVPYPVYTYHHTNLKSRWIPYSPNSHTHFTSPTRWTMDDPVRNVVAKPADSSFTFPTQEFIILGGQVTYSLLLPLAQKAYFGGLHHKIKRNTILALAFKKLLRL